MGKERKSVAFSTRFTESMELALNELSEVKMLTKHDIVRIAISDYLLKNKYLIDENVLYKRKASDFRYDEIELTISKHNYKSTKEYWISGFICDDEGKEIGIDELVQIEVMMPEVKETGNISKILESLKQASDEEKRKIEKELDSLLKPQFVREYTLRYTEKGVKAKGDPRLDQVIEKSIEEIMSELRSGN